MTDPQEITKRFWKELAISPYVMVGLEDGHRHHLPMTAQLDPDAEHRIWFYTSRGNRLAPGGPAMAHFASQGHDLFACIDGTLSEESDPAVIDRFWSKTVESWYPSGRHDPKLMMLRFDLGTAEIWLADATLKGMFKMITGDDVRGEYADKHVEIAL
jgi:general stress protein 26